MYAVAALITIAILTWAMFDGENEAERKEAPSNKNQVEVEEVKQVA